MLARFVVSQKVPSVSPLNSCAKMQSESVQIHDNLVQNTSSLSVSPRRRLARSARDVCNQRREGVCVVSHISAQLFSVSDFGLLFSTRHSGVLPNALRNLSTTLRHWRLRFTEQSLLLWMWQVG